MRSWVGSLSLRDALLIGFFAFFLVAARAALRWHLHVPGHSMFVTAFGLVLVRSCVQRRAAASACGLVAGLVCAALGMGKGGPLIALKLLIPGAIVDAGHWLREPRRGPISLRAGFAIGAVAGASGFLPLVGVEWLAGLEPRVIALHAVAAAGSKGLFGAAGGTAGVLIARELRHHGILDSTAI